METLRGAAAYALDRAIFAQTLAQHAHVVIDLGTGDGRFVQHLARANPTWYVIGIDACRENLRVAARTAPANAQFLIANALALPHALHGAAAHLTINFPWGSLLRGLLQADLGMISQIMAITQPHATLEIRLNAGALAEADWDLDRGCAQVRGTLIEQGWQVAPAAMLDGAALRMTQTTWAKRLAFGRDPRARLLRAVRRADSGPAS